MLAVCLAKVLVRERDQKHKCHFFGLRNIDYHHLSPGCNCSMTRHLSVVWWQLTFHTRPSLPTHSRHIFFIGFCIKKTPVLSDDGLRTVELSLSTAAADGAVHTKPAGAWLPGVERRQRPPAAASSPAILAQLLPELTPPSFFSSPHCSTTLPAT